MKKSLRTIGVILAMLPFICSACGEKGTGWDPSMIPDDPIIDPQPDDPGAGGDIHTYKAPLYWSVYEYCREAEKAGVAIDMPEVEWDRVINWVSENLLPYGYDMICTDGFMFMHGDTSYDPSGYMTTYGSMKIKDLVAKCKAKGLKLGIYDNPLWLHAPDETKVQGTNITFGSLRYNSTIDRSVVKYPNVDDLFWWVVPSHPGAREYIDGFFKYYKELGVEFIRMDFLCTFEMGSSCGNPDECIDGRGYGRDNYRLALQYIRESAAKYGIFTSLVMPNCYYDAELEAEYGNMFRVVADTFDGGWDHVSNRLRGCYFDHWPSCHNVFDGYVRWSHLTGRDRVIPDGDFLRLNTLRDGLECEVSISINLMAGGPISVADQYNTIGDRLHYYQNEEMLALNKDHFVGKPLGDWANPADANNQIWYGQMSDGAWIIGFFNREDSRQTRSLEFSRLGISGKMHVRDLWRHQDEGETDRLSVTLDGHSCKIVKLTPVSE